jgi:hypothetical protein
MRRCWTDKREKIIKEENVRSNVGDVSSTRVSSYVDESLFPLAPPQTLGHSLFRGRVFSRKQGVYNQLGKA